MGGIIPYIVENNPNMWNQQPGKIVPTDQTWMNWVNPERFILVHLFTMPLRPEKTSASPHQLENNSFIPGICREVLSSPGPVWINISIWLKYVQLVGGTPTPLKNDGVCQLGLLFPTEWKTIKFMFQTTNQHRSMDVYSPSQMVISWKKTWFQTTNQTMFGLKFTPLTSFPYIFHIFSINHR